MCVLHVRFDIAIKYQLCVGAKRLWGESASKQIKSKQHLPGILSTVAFFLDILDNEQNRSLGLICVL